MFVKGDFDIVLGWGKNETELTITFDGEYTMEEAEDLRDNMEEFLEKNK